jgi:hypothetical protein
MRIVGRIMLPLALGLLSLTVSTALGASSSPCQIVPAEVWSGIMGYTVTAAPGDMNCTYSSKRGGGQFRILGTLGSSSEAEVSAKRVRDRQATGNTIPASQQLIRRER